MKKKILILVVICSIGLFGAKKNPGEIQKERLLKEFQDLKIIKYKDTGRSMLLYKEGMGEKVNKEENTFIKGMVKNRKSGKIKEIEDWAKEYTYARVKLFKGDRYRRIFYRTTEAGTAHGFLIEGINDAPTFSIWQYDGLPGDILIIPGDGYIYLREYAAIKQGKLFYNMKEKREEGEYFKFGDEYSVFNRVIKYKVEGEKLVEVSTKNHYLEGTLNLIRDIKMYRNKEMKEEIGVAKKGEKVYLILQWGDEDKYMVRDASYQVGWTSRYVGKEVHPYFGETGSKRIHLYFDLTYINDGGDVFRVGSSAKKYKEYVKEYQSE